MDYSRKKVISDSGMYDYFKNKEYIKMLNEFIKPIQNDNFLYNLTGYHALEKYHNLQVIYEQEDAEKQIALTDQIMLFLQEYVGIEGLEELLSSNYTTIENNIFFETKEETGEAMRTREHNKHQFRNVYLGSVLLLNCGFLETVCECIKKEDSMLSLYIKSQVNREQKLQSTKQGDSSLKEVIYKSYFLAALFHDIGYPLAYYMRVNKQMMNFLPYMKVISSKSLTDFNEINVLLSDSLLFHYIDADIIRKRFNDYDHGVLSAVSFLLQFYTAGKIYSLSPIDRCIIEISAIAIYRHTEKYKKNRIIFAEDPISYMVRMVDDLQEWQRFSLLIDSKHNYLKCLNCGKMINPENDSLKYICDGCKEEFEKITSIQNRKVNYISVCDKLEIALENDEKQNSALDIYICYNPYKQIEIMLTDYKSMKYRRDDLIKLEELFQYQKYLPQIKLHYCLSNNPIKLINEMILLSKLSDKDIEKRITQMKTPGKYKDNMKMFWFEFKKIRNNEADYGEDLEENEIKFGVKAQNYVLNNMGQIHTLYKLIMYE